LFEVSEGALPPGLDLDGETGEITGRPTTEGEFTFTIDCTDSSEPAVIDDQDYIVTVYSSTDIFDEDIIVPSNFALIGNYPNPFNSSTVIRFRLADPATVELEIFNVLGQRVETLQTGYMAAGEHELVWNADAVPSGVYFCRLMAGDRSAVQKMTLIK
jgi:hypothetical protein